MLMQWPKQQNVGALKLVLPPFFSQTMPSIGPHTVRGATKEKSRKLDELKAKRKAKDEKQRVRPTKWVYARCSRNL